MLSFIRDAVVLVSLYIRRTVTKTPCSNSEYSVWWYQDMGHLGGDEVIGAKPEWVCLVSSSMRLQRDLSLPESEDKAKRHS